MTLAHNLVNVVLEVLLLADEHREAVHLTLLKLIRGVDASLVEYRVYCIIFQVSGRSAGVRS